MPYFYFQFVPDEQHFYELILLECKPFIIKNLHSAFSFYQLTIDLSLSKHKHSREVYCISSSNATFHSAYENVCLCKFHRKTVKSLSLL